MIIEYFLSGIPYFDQEYDMLIIEGFYSSLELLSSIEFHELNIESRFNKQLIVFSHISKLSHVSRTLQPRLMVMLGSCHRDDIYDFC